LAFARKAFASPERVTRKFLDANPSPRLVRDVIAALRDDDNDITLSRLVGMAKGLGQ
jgi:hypothetical protein